LRQTKNFNQTSTNKGHYRHDAQAYKHIPHTHTLIILTLYEIKQLYIN